MKVCNAEAMKKIKGLEEELNKIKYNEETNCTISYKEGEEKNLPNYNYLETRKNIERINKEIRNIKNALQVANSTYKIDIFNITIGEALVYLAQLNNEYSSLNNLSTKNKISRRITQNGVVEYTECIYDPEQVKKEEKELYEKIGKLQVAIDRANLNCIIEI